MDAEPFVPEDFDPPRELKRHDFHLVPLGGQHNESDHAAWTSSIAHIRATPGFASWDWPPVAGMSLDANRADLERHARDFAERTGFTFTVLRPGTAEVIGCLYIYPATDGEGGAQVRSWVRADVAALDGPLHDAVSRWLDERWPFARVIYAERPRPDAVLRDVELDDIEIFYAQEADPVANAMAAFPARDRTAHAAHWQRVLAHDSNVARTIVEEGQVAGYIGSWEADGQRLVGYWIGRDHWGRGIATRALADFVAEVTERPLHAHVAEHNRASIRVLVKCGFEVVGSHQASGEPIREIILRLDSA